MAAHGAVFVVQVNRKHSNSSYMPATVLNTKSRFSDLTSTTHELGIVTALVSQTREPRLPVLTGHEDDSLTSQHFTGLSAAVLF